MTSRVRVTWFARIIVGVVFAVNVWCALSFILDPGSYTGAFELEGLPGRLVVQSFGILFLMWNATYPPVLVDPLAQRTLFRVILIQQIIAVVGETWLALSLPAGHPIPWTTALRFTVFDAISFIAMGCVYLIVEKEN
ncbi:MAG: hypothetical protein HY868_05445 [Chloroflexi bacterium]|nr:hypothetical protein [Chloroflexota bacterium]